MLNFTFVLFLLAIGGACTTKGPSFTEFQPTEESPFRIIFFYPQNWKWEMTPDTGKSYGTMYALNPYPVKDLKETGRIIGIHVNLRPQTKMQEDIELDLKTIVNSSLFVLLDDRIIQIDGRDARWITHKRKPIISHGETQPYIAETIYLMDNDRYYVISLSILEEEMNGQFHTEFKTMVESIRFLP